MLVGRNARATNAVNSLRAKPLIILARETGFISLRKCIVEASPSSTIISAAVSVSAASAGVKVSDLRRRFLRVLSTCAKQISETLERIR
jgi:hypothetical protein